MTRNKVKLAFILNDYARKASYNKRKKGIIKKVNELTILCGIPACAVISNPFDSTTEVWPDLEGAKQLIKRYQNGYIKDKKNNLDQESFLLQKITKTREQLEKQIQKNHENELNILMVRNLQNQELTDDLTVTDLRDYDKLIEKKMKEIDDKIVALNLSN